MAALVHGLLLGPPGESLERDAWTLGLQEAVSLQDALWVDSRSEALFAKGHYPDAIHLTDDNWDASLGILLMEWDPGRPVIVYCDGDGCESSRAIAARLRGELQVDSVYWLSGGWPSLVQGGFVP